jgi:hypothetical protein
LEQVWGLDGLPDHHQDPFDRLLIAQGQAEGMRLVSADGILGMYAVELLVGLDLVGGSPPVGNRSTGKNITEIVGGRPPVGNPVQPT